MMRFGVLALVLMALGAGSLWLGERGARAVERLLAARAEHALGVIGIDWASVRADGLLLELHGHAPDTDARDLALETARATTPPATVVDHTTVSLAPPRRRAPLRVELMRDGSGVTMTGRFHGAGMRARLLQALKAAAPNLDVRDLTGTNAARPGAGWGSELAIAAVAVARLPDAYVRIEPGALRIEGLARDEAHRARLADALLDLAGDAVQLSLNLRQAPRVAVPFVFAAVKDGSGEIRAEICHARDADEAARLEAALARLGVAPGERRCPVALGGPPGAWVDAAEAGLAALDTVPAGRFRLEYRSASLDAAPGTPRAAVRSARSALANGLPEGFALADPGDTATTPAAEAGAAEYRLRARRGPDGAAMHGLVPHETARRMIVTYAEAQLGPLDARLAEAPATQSAPPGWEPAVLVALEALARVGAGEVEVSPGRIRLTGQVEAPAEAGRIHRQAVVRAPDGYAVETGLTVDLPARAAAVPPSPARCARLLNGVMAERPITFEPGKTAVGPGSDPALDRLAGILGRCPAARIEIGGHTDNRGPEDLNQRLSRLRAESVLDALIARGVPLARVTARGYGEEEPVASNATEAGRAQNRRIGFKVLECRTRQAAC